MSRVHTLKITDGWWGDHVDGSKPYEVRRNDRGFLFGDIIRFTDLCGCFRGRARITNVVTGIDGLDPRYAILTVKRLITYEAANDLPERHDVDEPVLVAAR